MTAIYGYDSKGRDILQDINFMGGGIGLWGGAGLNAGIDCQKKISQYNTQQGYNDGTDAGSPYYVFLAQALPGITHKGIVDTEIVKKAFFEQLHTLLEYTTVHFVGIACNSLHIDDIFIEAQEIASTYNKGIVNIVHETVSHINSTTKTNSVLIISSESTNKKNIYKEYLEDKNIYCHNLSTIEQDIVSNFIQNIIGGSEQENDVYIIADIIYNYICNNPSIDSICLACTELSVNGHAKKIGQYLHTKGIDIGITDSNRILAKSLVEIAKGNYIPEYFPKTSQRKIYDRITLLRSLKKEFII